MSLFGGDSAPVSDGPSSDPGPPLDDSDFSIEEVGPPSSLPRPVHVQPRNREHSSSPQSPQSDDSHGSSSQLDNNNDYDDHDDYDDDDDDDASINSEEKRQRAWLYHTEDDRGLATSLDQLRANDLAIHLYNAHALKARLRQTEDVANLVSTRAKSKWIPRDEKTGEQPWYPDDEWTAWPLKPHRVPAGDRMFGAPRTNEDGLDAFTVKNPRSGRVKVSQGLEEELSAVFLAKARTMWQQRPKHTLTQPQTPSRQPLSRMESRSMSRDRSRSRSVSRPPNAPQDPDTLVTPLSHSSPHHPSSPLSSQFRGTPLKPDAHDDDHDHDPQPFPPVFSADEDRSLRLLAPAIRHVMSNLDNLLLALHHQRDCQDIYTEDEESDHESARSPLEASTSRSVRYHDRDTDMLDADALPSGDEHEDSNTTPKKPRHHEQSFANSAEELKPGLQDWSQVLGVAAMTGWNPSVIERAAKRCAALFGENMTFRTFPEHGRAHTGRSLDAEDDENEADTRLAQSETGYVCPHPLCERHTKPYEQAKRWREHLRRHGESNDQIAAREKQMELNGQVSKIARQNALDHNPMEWVPPDPLKCPHCRNSPLYARVSRLLDHLRRTHRYDPRLRRAPPVSESPNKKGKRPARDTAGDSDADGHSGSDEGSANGDDDDAVSEGGKEDRGGSGDEMFGGVHVDGFLRPCLVPGGRGKDTAKRLKDKASKRKRELFEEDEGEDEEEEE